MYVSFHISNSDAMMHYHTVTICVTLLLNMLNDEQYAIYVTTLRLHILFHFSLDDIDLCYFSLEHQNLC